MRRESAKIDSRTFANASRMHAYLPKTTVNIPSVCKSASQFLHVTRAALMLGGERQACGGTTAASRAWCAKRCFVESAND
eukprot:2387932-Prymnesium_polylepis.1